MTRTEIRGSELQARSVIEVWWKPRQEFVTHMERIAPFYGERRIAHFASGLAMTVYDDDCLTVLSERAA